jgi:hypothetical protein
VGPAAVCGVCQLVVRPTAPDDDGRCHASPRPHLAETHVGPENGRNMMVGTVYHVQPPYLGAESDQTAQVSTKLTQLLLFQLPEFQQVLIVIGSTKLQQ